MTFFDLKNMDFKDCTDLPVFKSAKAPVLLRKQSLHTPSYLSNTDIFFAHPKLPYELENGIIPFGFFNEGIKQQPFKSHWSTALGLLAHMSSEYRTP